VLPGQVLDDEQRFLLEVRTDTELQGQMVGMLPDQAAEQLGTAGIASRLGMASKLVESCLVPALTNLGVFERAPFTRLRYQVAAHRAARRIVEREEEGTVRWQRPTNPERLAANPARTGPR
jgi:hypothetical protein